MLKLRTLAAGIAATAAVAMVATAAVPALADPPGEIHPAAFAIVGVGANTDENLFNALTGSYDATIAHPSAAHPHVYSFNATLPGSTSTAIQHIEPKIGCSATTVRPNGSGAGLKALDQNTKDGKTGDYCLDFSRSSSGRSSTSPAPGMGGVSYVALATDAVTYATRDTGATKTVPATYAPKSLTLAQLRAIYTCKDLNWSQGGLGGPNQPIKAYLPQISSGTYSFFIKKLGITSQGPCVNVALEENQGLSKQFNSPNAIFIYSVADWIAQKYHSPLAGQKPTAAQNKFGTDQVGYLGLNKIDGISPVTTAKIPTINTAFAKTTFTRTIYDVVRWTAGTPGHLPKALVPFFASKASKGYVCTNKTAITEIADYGFLPNASCGSSS
jgi:ABC-type phosphate transport system substrate-binding protein